MKKNKGKRSKGEDAKENRREEMGADDKQKCKWLSSERKIVEEKKRKEKSRVEKKREEKRETY